MNALTVGRSLTQHDSSTLLTSSKLRSMSGKVTTGNALRLPLADNSVTSIVTSPPYFGLRAYGDSSEELGRGSFVDYSTDMTTFGLEAMRVLRDNGTLWLNMGDTYAGSGGAGGDYNSGGKQYGKPKWKQGDSGLERGQLMMVPHRIASSLQSIGFLLRSCIVWDKQSVRPEDVEHVRRPLAAHEYIFMFSTQVKCKFYGKRLTEKGNVWHFPPVRGKHHFAPFPDELARRCIEVSTNRGDVVLDPFAGSGTTALVAHNMGRVGLGFDIYAEGE